MPVINQLNSIDISPLKFLRACSDTELQEINLLLNNAEFATRLQTQNGQLELPEANEVSQALQYASKSSQLIHNLIVENIPIINKAYIEAHPGSNFLMIWCHECNNGGAHHLKLNLSELSFMNKEILIESIKRTIYNEENL